MQEGGGFLCRKGPRTVQEAVQEGGFLCRKGAGSCAGRKFLGRSQDGSCAGRGGGFLCRKGVPVGFLERFLCGKGGGFLSGMHMPQPAHCSSPQTALPLHRHYR